MNNSIAKLIKNTGITMAVLETLGVLYFWFEGVFDSSVLPLALLICSFISAITFVGLAEVINLLDQQERRLFQIENTLKYQHK